MHFVRPGKLSTKTLIPLVHKEWQGERARTRVGQCTCSKLQFRCAESIRKPRATCKDRPLHSSRFDSAFLHSFSHGQWASPSMFLHFTLDAEEASIRLRFDFAAFALQWGYENGCYELTSGTMRYARPTNASGNNAWSRVISTAVAANMNNLGRSDSDALTSYHACYAEHKYPESLEMQLDKCFFFFYLTSTLTTLIIYIDFINVNLKVELTIVNSFLFFSL